MLCKPKKKIKNFVKLLLDKNKNLWYNKRLDTRAPGQCKL